MGGSLGGRQRYPQLGFVGQDVGVGIWSTAWGAFLRSLEEGIGTAVAMAVVTSPTTMVLPMTTTGMDAVAREKDGASYTAPSSRI